MARHHSPPPTRYGPAAPAQAKAAGPRPPPSPGPPPTRFGPVTRLALPAGVIQRMDPAPSKPSSGTKGDTEGELRLYDNCVLTKSGGESVDLFAKKLANSTLFAAAILWAQRHNKKITLITGYHGYGGDTAHADGMFERAFDTQERGQVTSSPLNGKVTLNLLPVETTAPNALSIVKTTIDAGFVFYAWCFSDALIDSKYRIAPSWK